jgi:hypothetical protein
LIDLIVSNYETIYAVFVNLSMFFRSACATSHIVVDPRWPASAHDSLEMLVDRLVFGVDQKRDDFIKALDRQYRVVSKSTYLFRILNIDPV